MSEWSQELQQDRHDLAAFQKRQAIPVWREAVISGGHYGAAWAVLGWVLATRHWLGLAAFTIWLAIVFVALLGALLFPKKGSYHYPMPDAYLRSLSRQGVTFMVICLAAVGHWVYWAFIQ